MEDDEENEGEEDGKGEDNRVEAGIRQVSKEASASDLLWTVRCRLTDGSDVKKSAQLALLDIFALDE